MALRFGHTGSAPLDGPAPEAASSIDLNLPTGDKSGIVRFEYPGDSQAKLL
jgi:hypothetical protein